MLDKLFSGLRVFDIDPAKLRSKNFYEDFIVRERATFWQERKVLNKAASEAHCFLCGARQGHSLFLEHDGYCLLRCAECDVIFANIRVDEDYHRLVYANEDYAESFYREVVDTWDYRMQTFGKERLAYLGEKCTFDPSEHSLLDVGCGVGYFLKYLQDADVRCKGLEVTASHVEFCRSQGLNVASHNLAEEHGQYNVVTMFDVLEHLAQPVQVFKEAAACLEEGGYLLAYTPNILSFAFYFQGAKQNLLLPYEHLCFYTPQSLQYLAAKSGFEITSVEYCGLDLVDYLAMKQYEDGIAYNEKLRDVIPYLQALIDKQQLANHMRVVFKKRWT